MLSVIGIFIVFVHLKPSNGVSEPPGTTRDFEAKFLKQCKDYKAQVRTNTKDCSVLLTKFKQAWVGKDPCQVFQADYKPFTDAASITIPKGKSLFWSGSKPDAMRVAQNGKRMWALESTMHGYLVNDIMFCGKLVTDEDKSGINYKECPRWNSCPGHAMQNYWKAASTWFAKAASGKVYVLISGNRKPAYSPTSIFKTVELPALKKGERNEVTEVITWMINETVSNCKETSMKQMEKDVKARGFPYSCTDNPDLFARPINDVKKNPTVKTAGKFIKSTMS